VKEIGQRDQTTLVHNSEGNMGIEIKTKQNRSQHVTTLKKNILTSLSQIITATIINI